MLNEVEQFLILELKKRCPDRTEKEINDVLKFFNKELKEYLQINGFSKTIDFIKKNLTLLDSTLNKINEASRNEDFNKINVNSPFWRELRKTAEVIIKQSNFKKIPSIEITLDIDANQAMKIVIDFFEWVTSNTNEANFFQHLSDKISQYLFLNKIKFILKKDTKMRNGNGRSVTRNGQIDWYWNKQLSDLITLAHEVCHSYCYKNSKRKNVANYNYAEVESLLTEELFKYYLKTKRQNLVIQTAAPNYTFNRISLDEAIDYISYTQMDNTINIAHRINDELALKEILDKKPQLDIIDLINLHIFPQKMKIINEILGHYLEYDDNGIIIHSKPFSLKNGEHLSNEIRFIIGYAISKSFINTPRPLEKTKQLYKKYINNAKQEKIIQQLFGITFQNLSNNLNHFLEEHSKIQKRFLQNTKEYQDSLKKDSLFPSQHTDLFDRQLEISEKHSR